jgi:hypothetical protein
MNGKQNILKKYVILKTNFNVLAGWSGVTSGGRLSGQR